MFALYYFSFFYLLTLKCLFMYLPPHPAKYLEKHCEICFLSYIMIYKQRMFIEYIALSIVGDTHKLSPEIAYHWEIRFQKVNISVHSSVFSDRLLNAYFI